MSTCSCPACGTSVPAGRFCAACGTALSAHPAVSAVPLQPTVADAEHWARETVRAAPAPVQCAQGAEHGTAETLPLPPPPVVPPRPLDVLPATDVLPAAAPPYEPPPYVPGGYVAPDRSFAPAARRDSRSRGAVAVTVAALAVGGWVLFGQGGDHTVTGSLSLVDATYSAYSAHESCTGSGGYDDIGAGTEVVLEDGNGRTLATTSLESGSYDGVSCVFAFTLPDVARADFYVLSLGNAVRGDERYSYEDMVEQDWSTELVLGDD